MGLNLLHRVGKDKLMHVKYLEQQVLYKMELRFRRGFVFNDENFNRLRCYSHERLNGEKVYTDRKGWSGFTVKPVDLVLTPLLKSVKRSDTYRISIWRSSETILESGA